MTSQQRPQQQPQQQHLQHRLLLLTRSPPKQHILPPTCTVSIHGWSLGFPWTMERQLEVEKEGISLIQWVYGYDYDLFGYQIANQCC